MISESFLSDLSLWGCLWQSTIFIALGLLAGYFLRNRPSRSYHVLLFAMIAAAIVPFISAAVKHYNLGILPESTTIRTQEEPVLIEIGQERNISDIAAPMVSRLTAVNPVSVEATSKHVPVSWHTVALNLWIITSLVLLIRLVVTFIYGAYLVEKSKRSGGEKIQQVVDQVILQLRLSCDLQVRCSGRVRSPIVWCWSNPSILLVPNTSDEIEADWSGVVAHELAHSKRWDHITGLVAELVVCLLPWHPLIWLSKKYLVRLGEQACDDWVVASGQSCEDYAESLLHFRPQRKMAFLPAVVHSKKGLAGRIDRILKDSCGNPHAGAKWGLATCSVVFCFILGVAFAQTQSKSAIDEVSTEPPYRAASQGDITTVEQWLAQGGDVNAKNEGVPPLLSGAILGGHLNIIQLLEKHGADIDAQIHDPFLIKLLVTDGSPAVADYLISRGADTSHVYVAAYIGKLDQVKEYIESGSQQVSASEKNQILMAAITGGRANIIEYLLDHGAVIGERALFRAVRANRKQILELLIDKGADPNPGGNWSPLHITIECYPRLEIAKALLSHGADPFEGAWNPMHYALESGTKDMVKLFLAHHRDRDLLPYVNLAMKENRKDVLPFFEPYVEISPIHLSCFHGKLDEVKSYLEQDKDIDAQDIGSLSLLHFAVVGCQIEVVDYLITKGCNVNSKASDGATALHYAANGNGKGEVMVQRLITGGALVEAKDKDDCTPFFYSVSGVSVDLGAAQLLLKHGADVNIQTKGWPSALHNAAWRNNMKTMEWLIAKGADVNIGKDYTPLTFALHEGKLSAVRYLIEHGADVNCRDWEGGQTPLQFAVRKGKKDIVEMVLNNGADISVKNNEGDTALDIASQRKYTEIVELLQKHGAK